MDARQVNNAPAKLEYQAPAIRVIGTLEQITQATNNGLAIDGVYPAHTPIAGHIS